MDPLIFAQVATNEALYRIISVELPGVWRNQIRPVFTRRILRGGTHLNTKYKYFGECKWSPRAAPVRRPLHQIRFAK